MEKEPATVRSIVLWLPIHISHIHWNCTKCCPTKWVDLCSLIAHHQTQLDRRIKENADTMVKIALDSIYERVASMYSCIHHTLLLVCVLFMGCIYINMKFNFVGKTKPNVKYTCVHNADTNENDFCAKASLVAMHIHTFDVAILSTIKIEHCRNLSLLFFFFFYFSFEWISVVVWWWYLFVHVQHRDKYKRKMMVHIYTNASTNTSTHLDALKRHTAHQLIFDTKQWLIYFRKNETVQVFLDAFFFIHCGGCWSKK